jgi:hypothetical protein
VITLITSAFCSELHDPFPIGFSMGDLGALQGEDESRGRQPWISSAFCSDSVAIGFACAGVSFYDQMGNVEDNAMCRGSAGVWYSRKYLKLKIAVSHLSALGIYYEQFGFFSLGIDVGSKFRIGADITGTRIGIYGQQSDIHTIGEIGFAGLLPLRFVSVSFSVNHIQLNAAKTESVNPPITIKCGIHTAGFRFGAQGILMEVTPTNRFPIRLIFAEEYLLFYQCGLFAAIANNPLMVGFGAVFHLPHFGTDVSFVSHPALGWSKGFAAEFYR